MKRSRCCNSSRRKPFTAEYSARFRDTEGKENSCRPLRTAVRITGPSLSRGRRAGDERLTTGCDLVDAWPRQPHGLSDVELGCSSLVGAARIPSAGGSTQVVVGSVSLEKPTKAPIQTHPRHTGVPTTGPQDQAYTVMLQWLRVAYV